MNRFIPALAAACFALSAATAFAQATTPPAGAGMHKGPTPEQREKMREAYKGAQEACKDKPDRQACMGEQMCAKSEDKARCQARMKERHEKMGQRMDQHQAIAEACTGKRGDDLKKCYREEAQKRGMKHDRKG